MQLVMSAWTFKSVQVQRKFIQPVLSWKDEGHLFNKKKNMTSAELSRLRKERKKESDPLGLGTGSTNKSNRRPEVGISIKIDDFNS